MVVVDELPLGAVPVWVVLLGCFLVCCFLWAFFLVVVVPLGAVEDWVVVVWVLVCELVDAWDSAIPLTANESRSTVNVFTINLLALSFAETRKT